jgi:hypothetical protein
LNYVLTLLLGEMLDGARCGPHGSKLHLYVKVGTFDQLEQRILYIVAVTSSGVERLTVQHDLMVSVCFM